MEKWDDIVIDIKIKLHNVQDFLSSYREAGQKIYSKYYVVSTPRSSGLKGLFVYNESESLDMLASYLRANDGAGVRAGLRLAIVSSTVPWHGSSLAGATLGSWFVPTLRVDSTEPMKDCKKIERF
jgi:phenylacetate-CoA ligase